MIYLGLYFSFGRFRLRTKSRALRLVRWPVRQLTVFPTKENLQTTGAFFEPCAAARWICTARPSLEIRGLLDRELRNLGSRDAW
jgi:hypothetical protein